MSKRYTCDVCDADGLKKKDVIDVCGRCALSLPSPKQTAPIYAALHRAIDLLDERMTPRQKYDALDSRLLSILGGGHEFDDINCPNEK